REATFDASRMQDGWGNPGHDQVSAMEIEETRTAKNCEQRGSMTAANLEVFEKV
ncbi:hypothetical protein PAXRUDRAFT_833426, partial [Paxillus rubicundulus Ve08.2h10]